MKKTFGKTIGGASLSLISGCMIPGRPPLMTVPAQEYSQHIREQYTAQSQRYPGRLERSGQPQDVNSLVEAQGRDDARARIRFASAPVGSAPQLTMVKDEVDGAGDPGYTVQRSTMQNSRDYTGPLTLGDPGVTASLWQESRSGNDLFRDDRAWQPMDLITIVVTEKSEGKKEANTEVKENSTVSAAISKLLGFETDIKNSLDSKSQGAATPSALIDASSQNDFKGQGKTDRKGSLTARISAMVAEVLPSGILRIEGKKIISVNAEEQIMIISGLVRPRDINSDNEVDSSKIAQLRIDYYGEGTVGEAQNGGWLGRTLRRIWPF